MTYRPQLYEAANIGGVFGGETRLVNSPTSTRQAENRTSNPTLDAILPGTLRAFHAIRLENMDS